MAKARLRGVWLQVHLWIGLILGLALIALGLTGALLVVREGADRMLNPQRYAVSPGAATRSIADYVAAGSAALAPGERPTQVRLPEQAGGPVVVTAVKAPAGRGRGHDGEKAGGKPGEGGDKAADKGRSGAGRAGPPARHMIWLDPGTGRVLDHGSGMSGVMRFAHDLHGRLLIPAGNGGPGLGRTLVGWLGVAMLISSLTGIWLWWPRNGNLLKAFGWKRGPLLSGRLHHRVGIWIAVPLAVVSFTGAAISFPKTLAALSGSHAAPGGGPRGGGAPLELTDRGPDAAVATALQAAPGAKPVSVSWPTRNQPVWRVQVKPAQGAVRTVQVDDETGEASPAPEAGDPVARMMRKVHAGDDLGVWRWVVFLTGLAPALMAVTGLLMWLQQRGRRAAMEKVRAEAA